MRTAQKVIAMFTEITHITKAHPHDPHERIQEVGEMHGTTVVNRYTLDEAIAKDLRGDTKFFVMQWGQRVLVDVVPGGLLRGPYMRTRPDSTGVNNLLSLPQLPPHNSLLAFALRGNA